MFLQSYWNSYPSCIPNEHWCYLAKQPAFWPILIWYGHCDQVSSIINIVIISSINRAHCTIHNTQQPLNMTRPLQFTGQETPALFCFQLGSIFSGSEPVYFWSKCSELFKRRSVKWNRTGPILVEKDLDGPVNTSMGEKKNQSSHEPKGFWTSGL